MYEHLRFLLRAEERLRRMCFGGRERETWTKKEKRKKASELLILT